MCRCPSFASTVRPGPIASTESAVVAAGLLPADARPEDQPQGARGGKPPADRHLCPDGGPMTNSFGRTEARQLVSGASGLDQNELMTRRRRDSSTPRGQTPGTLTTVEGEIVLAANAPHCAPVWASNVPVIASVGIVAVR